MNIRNAIIVSLMILTPSTAHAAESSFVKGEYQYTVTEEVISDPLLTASAEVAAHVWKTDQCKDAPWFVLKVEALVSITSTPPNQALARMNECVRWIDPQILASRETQYVCLIVAHELGHNLGHEHSEDATSLMHGSIVNLMPECAPMVLTYKDRPWTNKNFKWCSANKVKCQSKYYRLYARAFNLRDAWAVGKSNRAIALKAQGL